MLSGTCELIISDASKSYWLKHALHTALDRDPVDAACDAETLARLLAERCNAILAADAAASDALGHSSR